jgi:hypothetical protein
MQWATYARRSGTAIILIRGEGRAHPADCPLLSFAIVSSGSQVSFARQAEAEGRSSALHALGHEITVLGPRELSGDGEPEARATACAAGLIGRPHAEALCLLREDRGEIKGLCRHVGFVGVEPATNSRSERIVPIRSVSVSECSTKFWSSWFKYPR